MRSADGGGPRGGDRERGYNIAGYGLWLVGSVLFTASAWQSGDPLTTIGGLVFVLGCVAALVPLLTGGRRG